MKEKITFEDFVGFLEKYKINYEDLKVCKFKKTELEFLFHCMSSLKNVDKKKTVLDVGCGESPLGAFLASRGYDVTVLDEWDDRNSSGSPELHETLMKITSTNYRIVRKNIIDFIKPNEYDFVIGLCFIEHVEDEREVCYAMENLLKEGGYLILTTIYENRFIEKRSMKNIDRSYNCYELQKRILNNFYYLNYDLFLNSGLWLFVYVKRELGSEGNEKKNNGPLSNSG